MRTRGEGVGTGSLPPPPKHNLACSPYFLVGPASSGRENLTLTTAAGNENPNPIRMMARSAVWSLLK